MFTLSAVVLNILSKRQPSARTSRLSTNTNEMASGDENKATVMFVLGGPGAGKGTQCANLVQV